MTRCEKDVSKVKKSKEKVVEYFDSDAMDDEFTSEEKTLMVSNLKKFFKKNLLKFWNGGNLRSKSGGSGYKGSNSLFYKKKSDGYKNYQQSDDEKKEKKLLDDSEPFYEGLCAEEEKRKKEKTKDEVSYGKKIEDLQKKNVQGKDLIVEEDDSDVENIKVDTTILKEETHTQTHMIRVLRDTILELDESLRWNKRKVANIDDNLSMCTFRSEERRLEIEKLEVDDIEEEIDAICYECASLV
uniref:Uncharacterized protein n=1 Tax=Lactuca sativa TaxID=4236 RepID=A0A9R1WHQ0_LACSA|nr:hypothetical protein LSAT_V11C200065190 [Lactuca sativa]